VIRATSQTLLESIITYHHDSYKNDCAKLYP